jgi:hypothetical protein
LRRRHWRTIACPSAIRAPIPQAAVLVGQQHQAPVRRGAAGPPGLDQQHEREQAHDLGLVRHELRQLPSEADGLGAEVVANEPLPGARRVALVEYEVHDRQHGAQAVGEVGVAWHPVRDPGVADLGLGPDQALGHRRFGDQERVGDLPGREPAQ